MLTEKIVHPLETSVTNCDDAQHLLERDFRTRYQETSLGEIVLQPNSMAQVGNEEFAVTQYFLENIAKFINMPLSYAYRCSFDLFNENFEKRKAKCNRPFQIAVNRNAVVGVAPVDYRPARTTDILDHVRAMTEKDWMVQRILISDIGTDIQLTRGSEQIEPKVGDAIRVGVSLTNSETGFRGAKASLFTYRLVCSNGAVMADDVGVARWNYDRRMHYSSSLKAFKSSLDTLVVDAESRIAPLYEQVANRLLSDVYFVKLWRRLTYAIPADRVLSHVFKIDDNERRAIQARVRERRTSEPESTRFRAFEIHNNITHRAQQERFLPRRRLEEIGGQLLHDVSLN